MKDREYKTWFKITSKTRHGTDPVAVISIGLISAKQNGGSDMEGDKKNGFEMSFS